MKKLLVIFIMLAFIGSIAIAPSSNTGAQLGMNDNENDDTGQNVDVSGNIDATPELTVAQNRVKATTTTELKQMIQERKQEMQQELESMNEKKEKVYRNQNRVREAVHALLVMEDLVGGIGKNVSEIARNFNNSVQKTIQAEEKIQKRDFISNFLFGGDQEAADEIEEEVNTNQNRIQQLKQYMNECNCTQEIKNTLQEQIQEMEQEQTRLKELSQNEKEKKSLFGWLFNNNQGNKE